MCESNGSLDYNKALRNNVDHCEFDTFFIENTEDQRLIKFRNTLMKARKSDFYRKILETFSTETLLNADFEILNRIPWTTKENLRLAGLAILAVPLHHTIRYYESSGTTGVPTPTPKTKNDIVDNSKSLLLNWQRILSSREDIVVLMLPSDLAPVADAMVYGLEAMDVLSVRAFPFAGNVCGWDQVTRVVQSLQANVLFSTPGLILYYYRELKKRAISPCLLGIKKILLVGELVTEPMRKMLERIWDADVYINSYGSSELGTCSTSCPQKKLHLLNHRYYFEMRDTITLEKTNDSKGELVVTTLTADARPLLRYCTGDYVKLIDEHCPCGMTSPIIEIMGRIGETVRVNNQYISQYEIESTVYGVEGVTGYRIYCQANGDISLEIEIEPEWDDDHTNLVLYQLKEKLPAKLAGINIIINNDMGDLAKRGGGIKNWKLSHVVRQ